MELVRQKNAATVIVFPIVDADGDFVTGATGLDSEIDAWADGSTPDGFADCTNEATEIGSSGIYHLSLTQTEMNNDYIVIQVKTTSSGAKTQMILINTMVGDPANRATNTSGRELGVAADGDLSGTVDGNVGGSVGSVTGNVGGNVTGSVGSVATGGIAAASFAAGAIDASAIAANAIGASEIADGAIDAATFAAGAITASVIATGAIDADALAGDAVDEIWDEVMEGTTTARQSIRLANSANGAIVAGAATTTVTIRDLADSKDRVTATVDANGNRTAVALDLT